MSDSKLEKLGGPRRERGRCQCGTVEFEVELEARPTGSRCNCSLCSRTGATSAILKPGAMRLLAGEAELGSYEKPAGIARRYFCKHCGIHCFGKGYLAEVGGDFVSVNLNCVDAVDPTAIPIIYWDGRHDNWEAGPRSEPWPTHASVAAA